MGKTVKREVAGNTKVQRQFKDEVDLKNIIRKYNRGILPSGNSGQSQFIDFTKIPDPIQALNVAAQLKGYFTSLPANVRLRFGNDPANLVHFMNDPNNKDEAIRLGLAKAPPKAAAAPKAAAEPSAKPNDPPST